MVAVGTAALVDPTAPVRILRELKDFMEEYGYKNVESLRGVIK
jgi:dihydroorotate dehydrogenase